MLFSTDVMASMTSVTCWPAPTEAIAEYGVLTVSPVMLVSPTVREEDGLAMSSRNKYFNEIQRWEAVCLYYALRSAKEMVKSGVSDTRVIAREMRSVMKATCPTAEIDYIGFNDLKSFEPRKEIVKDTVCSLAVKIHGVRLIDNMKLK